MPLVAATDLPRRSSTERRGESAVRTSAAHSGWEQMSIARMGERLVRASSAAEPAVEPMSIAPPRRNSLALLDPAENVQWTSWPPSAATVSSQPFSRMISDSGL